VPVRGTIVPKISKNFGSPLYSMTLEIAASPSLNLLSPSNVTALPVGRLDTKGTSWACSSRAQALVNIQCDYGGFICVGTAAHIASTI
jgi:hypothetical protein